MTGGGAPSGPADGRGRARVDGRVQRGEETRRAVLRRAVEIASVEGLEALSIGRLATDLGLSKSGVFAGFGSKEELQLATVRAARRIFYDAVIAPVDPERPALDRVLGYCETWLAYSRARIFPGGCFFYGVTAEFDARPGPVRDLLAESAREWNALLTDTLSDARATGALRPGADPAQLAFELMGFLEIANSQAVLFGTDAPYERADSAVRRMLAAEVADPALR